LGDEDDAGGVERTSEHTLYSAFNKKGPVSDNTSVIYMESRSTSLVEPITVFPQKKLVPPKLNLALVHVEESKDLDDLDI